MNTNAVGARTLTYLRGGKDLFKEIEKIFCFTIVLKDEEKKALTPRFEFYYEFVENSAEAKEVPLSAYI